MNAVELDDILAVQLAVSWAGEGDTRPARLGWWRTALCERDAGGDLLQGVAPRTWQWATLEAEPREALRLHPPVAGELDRPTTLLFAPTTVTQHVQIRLVGVPVDSMLEDSSFRWWPLDHRRSTTVPANAPTRFAPLGGQQLGGP